MDKLEEDIKTYIEDYCGYSADVMNMDDDFYDDLELDEDDYSCLINDIERSYDCDLDGCTLGTVGDLINSIRMKTRRTRNVFEGKSRG